MPVCNKCVGIGAASCQSFLKDMPYLTQPQNEVSLEKTKFG